MRKKNHKLTTQIRMFSKHVNNSVIQKDGTFMHKQFALLSQCVSEYYKILKNLWLFIILILININFMLLFYLPLQVQEQHSNKVSFKKLGFWHIEYG